VDTDRRQSVTARVVRRRRLDRTVLIEGSTERVHEEALLVT
jgi:hypothetical protein